MNNPFINAQKQLNQIAELAGVSKDILVQLQEPERILEVSIPVEMDDGSMKVFKGFRSQFNSVLGPYKGGIRYHPDVSQDEVKALSMWMTWKTSVLGLPLGGGKGGIIVDPHELSEGELERLSRGYIQKIYKYIGPEQDVPAPDMYTTAQVMAWMADEYSKLVGKDSPGVITGKPVEKGGSKGRDKATAQGGFYVLEQLLAKLDMKLAETTVAIQGFGNAGSLMAELASAAGLKICAVSDSRGAVYSADGLDVAKLAEHKKSTRSVRSFEGAKDISNKELLALEVGVLIPAALENQITADNADATQAKIILELANGPITPEADEILAQKNIIVVPDILANAGGVTVSYFEMLQNAENKYWSEKDVLQKLRKKMVNAFDTVWSEREDKEITMRQAAYVVAVKNIVKNYA